MFINTNKLYFKRLSESFPFLIIIFIIFPLVVFFGHHPTDHEFINSLSYRISLGQLPYKDFDYVRPPLSLYLHSLSFFFFENYAVLFSKAVFFSQMVFISHLSVKILNNINFLPIKNQSWMMIIFLLLSLHNFPATPWHTIDGIFFSIIGIYFFSNGLIHQKNYNYLLSGLCCGLAPLCKQNFMVIPVVLLLSIIILKRSKLLYALLGVFIVAGCFFFFLYQNNLINLFINSKSQGANLSSIILSLVEGFKVGTSYVILPSLVIYSILIFFSNTNLIAKKTSVLLLVLVFAFLNVLQLYIVSSESLPILLYQVILVSSIFLFIKNKKSIIDFFEANNLVLILLFFITITSMISWGYPYPLLYISPYFAVIFNEFEKKWGNIDLKIIAFAVMIFWLATSNIMYRDSTKTEAKNNLGQLYSRLNHIYVGDENFMLYKSIKEFSEGHVIETVIPDFPLYNYLYDKRPIFKIDWFLDLESSREPHAYLKEMEGKYFVIREKSYTESGHPKRMELCNLIKENGTLIKIKNDLSLYRFSGINNHSD